MANGLRLAAGIGAIAAVVILGVPYLCGVQFERQFRAGFDEASKQTPYPVTITRYARGLFSSEAETQIEIPLPSLPAAASGAAAAPPPEPVRITLHYAITHGPRLTGLHLAHVVTTPIWPTSVQADFTKIFDDQPAITLTSDIGLGGGISGTLVSPAVNTTLPAEGKRDEPLALKWGGITGEYQSGAAHDDVKVDLQMPQLDARDSKNQATLAGMALAVNLRRSPTSTLWLGTSRVDIGSIAINAPEHDAIKVDQASIVSEATEADGLLKSVVTLSATQGSFATTTVQKPLLRLSFSNLDAKAIDDWRKQIRTMMQSAPTSGTQQQAQVQQVMASLGALAPRLLARKPSFAIEELSFDDGRGPVKVTGEVHYVGNAVAGQPLNFVPTDVEAHGTAEMPVAVLDQLLALKSSNDVMASARASGGTNTTAPNPSFDTQAAAGVAKLQATLVEQSLVTIDGDRAKTVAEFKAGAITVNGKLFQGLPPPAH